VFHNLTPWVPSDYFNVNIPPYNLHSVYRDFNIRMQLFRTNILADNVLTIESLRGLSCLVSSLRSVAAFKRALGSFDLSLFLN